MEKQTIVIKIDTYTKAVLTIIAASLVLNLLAGFAPTASAGIGNTMDVNIAQIGGMSPTINPLPVQMKH
jgi:hypothetical protein